ncbi:neuron derived neurotrophic factor nord isoform X2 [Rhodnius prolixus]
MGRRCCLGVLMLCALVSASLDRRKAALKTDRRDLENQVIPNDHQVTLFIEKARPQTFFYLLQQDVEVLSITLTPCISPVSWRVSFRPTNETGRVDTNNDGEFLAKLDKLDGFPATYEKQLASKGLYMVLVYSAEDEGFVEMYATFLAAVSELRPSSKMTVTNRRPKGQVAVRWPPSPVDPQVTTYILVVNPLAPAKTLCTARREQRGQYGKNSWRAGKLPRHDIIIEDAGSRTSTTLSGLKADHDYFIELFCVNSHTNLTYLYSSGKARYQRTKPVPLKEGKIASANIRRLDGRVTFRYKVRRNEEAGGSLEWWVLACGRAVSVDAQVRYKRRSLLPRVRVTGYGTLAIDDILPGATYILRVNASDPEMLSKITAIQVAAGMHGLREPKLPENRAIHEYRSLRSCRSVTLGWHAALGQGIQYCVLAKEVTKENHFSPIPDQCRLQQRIQRVDYNLMQCLTPQTSNKTNIFTREVNNLKPGRLYDIQVIVKSDKSKILSYNVMRVRTKTVQ